jgi:hypothetical protein
MNIPVFWSRFQQYNQISPPTLKGFGEVRLASKKSTGIYFRVNETPSRLRVINTSNNVQIKSGTQWMDTGVHAELQPNAQGAGVILGVLGQVAAGLGIDIPTSIPADTAENVSGGSGNTTIDSYDDATPNNLPAGIRVPTVPLFGGAAVGFVVGKKMKKPLMGAFIGALAGYLVGMRQDPTDQWDYTVPM